MTDFNKKWKKLVGFGMDGKWEEAKKIWDEVAEDAWKYEDLSD